MSFRFCGECRRFLNKWEQDGSYCTQCHHWITADGRRAWHRKPPETPYEELRDEIDDLRAEIDDLRIAVDERRESVR